MKQKLKIEERGAVRRAPAKPVKRKRPQDDDGNEFVQLLNAKRTRIEGGSARQMTTTATSSTQLKTLGTTDDGNTQQESKTFGSVSDADRELMAEFLEDSETIFKQSETCYTHYKEMLRENNTQKEKRSDKKYFTDQVTVKKEGLFEKKIPTWASNFELLAKVTKIQQHLGIPDELDKETHAQRNTRISREKRELKKRLEKLSQELIQERKQQQQA